ncbi:MAG: PqqD family protein, partial [Gemmatimonadota bacterium]
SLLVREAWESIELDAVSSRVWQLLETPRTTTELVATLVREFDVTREQCRADLEPVLTALREAGALCLCQPCSGHGPAQREPCRTLELVGGGRDSRSEPEP